MTSPISVHDNVLVAYTVLAEEKRIVLHTEYREREPHEFADVIFEGVGAYHFENDLFGTIIFDVIEVDLAGLLREHAALFEKGPRQGWPRGWRSESESIEAFFHRLQMQAFELSSSYGMTGWVLARRMIINRRAARAVGVAGDAGTSTSA